MNWANGLILFKIKTKTVFFGVPIQKKINRCINIKRKSGEKV
jgi:hypothetical protein